jgi:prepilin-type N-terminal cleavage/methylation domain-containing protein
MFSSRAGLTLLELLIVLMVGAALVLVAYPTLQPSSTESLVEFTKTELHYLYNQENTYFTQHGKYMPFSELAKDAELGPGFDQRFASDMPVVQGVRFSFPNAGSSMLEITALLPDGTSYIIDQRGEIKTFQLSQSDTPLVPDIGS